MSTHNHVCVLRVLLVEDELMTAILAEKTLTDFGHEVIGPISRLDRAVEIAARANFDLAILDININGEEVYPVAEALAARGIPFIFTTGYGKTGLQRVYPDRPTVQKPYRADDLRTAIAEVCGRAT